MRIEALICQAELLGQYGVNYSEEDIRQLATAMDHASKTLWREILTRREAEAEDNLSSGVGEKADPRPGGLLANLLPKHGGAA